MSSFSKLLLTYHSFRKVNFPRYNSVLILFKLPVTADSVVRPLVN